MLTKTTNPFAVLNQRYKNARKYIVKNLYWSERTYYRKMNQLHELNERENEVIIEAYRLFLYEPLKAAFENELA